MYFHERILRQNIILFQWFLENPLLLQIMFLSYVFILFLHCIFEELERLETVYEHRKQNPLLSVEIVYFKICYFKGTLYNNFQKHLASLFCLLYSIRLFSLVSFFLSQTCFRCYIFYILFYIIF